MTDVPAILHLCTGQMRKDGERVHLCNKSYEGGIQEEEARYPEEKRGYSTYVSREKSNAGFHVDLLSAHWVIVA